MLRELVPGDRIEQLTISMTSMVFEDALTVLSYAASYPVRLRLRRCPLMLGQLEIEPAGDDDDDTTRAASTLQSSRIRSGRPASGGTEPCRPPRARHNARG